MANPKKSLTRMMSTADRLLALECNKCLRTAERQKSRATEMIETARDMVRRAAQMRNAPRLSPFP